MPIATSEWAKYEVLVASTRKTTAAEDIDSQACRWRNTISDDTRGFVNFNIGLGEMDGSIAKRDNRGSRVSVELI